MPHLLLPSPVFSSSLDPDSFSDLMLVSLFYFTNGKINIGKNNININKANATVLM
jgi:hypothetical protein